MGINECWKFFKVTQQSRLVPVYHIIIAVPIHGHPINVRYGSDSKVLGA